MKAIRLTRQRFFINIETNENFVVVFSFLSANKETERAKKVSLVIIWTNLQAILIFIFIRKQKNISF